MGPLKGSGRRTTGKEMGALSRWIHNLSLRQSFMLYMFLSILLGILAVVLLFSFFENMRQEVIYNYVDSYSSLLGFSHTRLYLADGRVIPFTAYESLCLQISAWGMALVIPLATVLCVVAAGFLFYRRRLQPGLQALSEAAGRIARNDLDFSLQYGRKDELGRPCASFESMRAALWENNAALWRTMEERRRFLRVFAHDLRTPLTVLRGYLELLMEGQGPASDVLATMDTHLSRMEAYVSGMSALRRLEDAAPVISPVDPADLRGEMRSAAQLLCNKAGLSLLFTYGKMAPLPLDRGLFLQIYDNLLSNALRYAKGCVYISLEQRENCLCLSVANDGPDFTEEQLRLATQPYYTGQDDGSHLGLGLYICQQLALAQGGFLSLDNSPQGACVTLAIPLTERETVP